jgi:hypothetical protein
MSKKRPEAAAFGAMVFPDTILRVAGRFLTAAFKNLTFFIILFQGV